MRMWAIGLLALQAASAGAAQSEPPRVRTFSEEASRQAAIYRSVGEQVPEGYEVGRSLLSYTVILSPEFRHSLAALGANDRWLDIGAGEGRAVLDYATSKYDVMLRGRGEKAKAVAISIEDRRTARWRQAAEELGPGQIEYLHGRRLREYAPEELGRFQLITDVLGGFSYTRYLSTYMKKTLTLLAVNGTLYTLLQDVRSEAGTNRPHYAGAPFLTEIVDRDGRQSKVCAWLKSISCVRVSCEHRADSTPPSELYRVDKICENVAVPELVPIHFEAGTPPERRYRLQQETAWQAESHSTRTSDPSSRTTTSTSNAER